MKFITTLLVLSASAFSVLAAPRTPIMGMPHLRFTICQEALLIQSLDAVKRDGSTEFDADLAILKRHGSSEATKRDGSTEFDADLAVLKRTVVDTTTRVKRDGSTEFDADLAVL
ncbi:hypothetical protein QBC34DRAFT_411281 [Podospora aff. communis PSN243]|uniref:Uncharacterized protein n=1 Tax=Podospora aff. communis PSN243 TaxID=3040156 RepID=A0AAV9GEU9_9PEZI|nr:hypothetical protein QBC34DRAFT_411281 [Podospora aff. communis PSN243]